MTISQPRAGYTLPVFFCAAAIAALRRLKGHSQPIPSVSVNLIEPDRIVEIPIEQVAQIKENMAIAITLSDPGDNLDLTRNTPIWAMVEFREKGEASHVEAGLAEDRAIAQIGFPQNPPSVNEQIVIQGGEGIGRLGIGGEAAIYSYARRLLLENLGLLLEIGENITVTAILPEGRQLAQRTSNQAFGVVEGLSLLGTTGISQPLSAPGQLEAYCEEIRKKACQFNTLVLCVGENGLDLAQKMGVNPEQLVKTANWIGPMLVEAGIQGVKEILLFGYHGKLMKLAGGIFHTHHHLADGRREILAAYGGQLGLATADLQTIFNSATAEEALKYLRALDERAGSDWVGQVYGAIASAIDQRSGEYIYSQCDRRLRVGSVLFDRDRQIIVKSEIGASLLANFC